MLSVASSTSRRRLPGSLSLAVAVALTVVAATGGPVTAEYGSRASDQNGADRHPDPAYMTAGDKVMALGKDKYITTFGGLVVNDDERDPSFEIYHTEISNEAKADFIQAASGIPVVFRRATESEDALGQLQARLTSAMPALEEDGVLIATSWPDIKTGRLYIEVVRLAVGDIAKIRSTIKSDLVVVRSTDALVAPTRLAIGLHDVPAPRTTGSVFPGVLQQEVE